MKKLFSKIYYFKDFVLLQLDSNWLLKMIQLLSDYQRIFKNIL